MIEFIIALMLAGIVTSGAFAIYNAQQKQWNVQDQVADMQASIRAATAELTTKIRMAGYKVPENIAPILGSNTNPDTIIIIYDSEDIVGVQTEQAMSQPTADLHCDGHDLSGLQDGDWAFIYDPSTKTGEFFEVTQVIYGTFLIKHNTMALSKSYPLGSKVSKMNRYKYYIDQSDPNHPNMMVQCWNKPAQIYADNITNLNFSYVLSNGDVVDAPTIPIMVREVRILVNGRNDKPDHEFFTPYRTRSLETRVNIRNLAAN